VDEFRVDKQMNCAP